MLNHREIYLPDGEEHLTMMIDKGPIVDGKGTYQYHKYKAALAATPDRRRVIDVGAHVGLWSMHFVRDFEAVEAFEPIEAHRDCFKRNVQSAKVKLWGFACGDHEGWVAMNVNPKSSGDTWVQPKADVAGTNTAQLTTIDFFGFKDVDLIKLDCEGYELYALKGAVETIKEWKPTIIVEQKPGRAEKYGLGRTDSVPFLEGLGMRKHAELGGDYIMVW